MPKNIQVPVVSFESNDETSVQFTLVNVDGDFGELQVGLGLNPEQSYDPCRPRPPAFYIL